MRVGLHTHLSHEGISRMASVPEGIPSGRVHSIDALRGFDMFWIVGGGAFVERILTLMGTPAAITGQFEHSLKDHVRGLIFPFSLHRGYRSFVQGERGNRGGAFAYPGVGNLFRSDLCERHSRSVREGGGSPADRLDGRGGLSHCFSRAYAHSDWARILGILGGLISSFRFGGASSPGGICVLIDRLCADVLCSVRRQEVLLYIRDSTLFGVLCGHCSGPVPAGQDGRLLRGRSSCRLLGLVFPQQYMTFYCFARMGSCFWRLYDPM